MHFQQNDPQLDTWEHALRHRELVSRIRNKEVAMLPVDGTNAVSVMKALSLAPCFTPVAGLVEYLCDFGLGHRLIPIGRGDSLGTELRPFLDLRLHRELAGIRGSAAREDIIRVMEMCASLVDEFSRSRWYDEGWIGGQLITGEADRPVMLWPRLYPSYKAGGPQSPFNLFRDFEIQLEGAQ